MVKLNCPECGKIFRLNRLIRHRNKCHPDTSVKELKMRIRAAAECNALQYSVIRFDGPTPMKSATQAFEAGRKKGYAGPPLRGGAVELGKKR